MKEYVLEKGNSMPLCVILDGAYFNFINGEVIHNESILKFLENGLRKKYLKIEKMDLTVYVIESYILPTYDRLFIGYNYQINGCSNFLDMNCQPVNDCERKKIIEHLGDGKYFQVLLWGE